MYLQYALHGVSFGPDIVRLESLWNISVRKIFGLPYNSHHYFIEPLSNMKHLKNILMRRFLSFLKQIKRSKKIIPKQLLNVIKNYTRSTTGNNIRNILLLCGKCQVEEIDDETMNQIRYHPFHEEDRVETQPDWRTHQLQTWPFNNSWPFSWRMWRHHSVNKYKLNSHIISTLSNLYKISSFKI